MSGIVRHYFARGNTAYGDYSLYHSAMQGLAKLYVLRGYPGTGKSTVLQRLADHAAAQDWEIELFHSPLNPEEIDALAIPGMRIGIAEEEACRPLPAGVEPVCIDFNQAVDENRIGERHRLLIEDSKNQLAAAYSKAYEAFAEALRIHDEWESFYIESMDFRKANKVAHELIESVLGGRSLDKKAAVRHLFFGAATSRGAVDHIQGLTRGMKTRIFLKGRAGSGKSTLLKRLAEAAESRGFDTEVFHCGFHPSSLDMLIFRELDLAIFDSTAPHEHFPDREGDSVLDMYEQVIAPGIDERYAVELDKIKRRYSDKMKEATGYLAEAGGINARIKAVYAAATDFSVVEQQFSRLAEAIAEINMQQQ